MSITIRESSWTIKPYDLTLPAANYETYDLGDIIKTADGKIFYRIELVREQASDGKWGLTMYYHTRGTPIGFNNTALVYRDPFLANFDYSNSSGLCGWYDSYAHGTLTFTKAQTVPDNFFAWFTANATDKTPDVDISGTWRFIDNIVCGYGGRDQSEDIFNVSFSSAAISTHGRSLGSIRVASTGADNKCDIIYTGINLFGSGKDSAAVYTSRANFGGEDSWTQIGYKTITFAEGTVVSGAFYNWLINNANKITLKTLPGGRWKWNSEQSRHERDFKEVKLSFTSGNKDVTSITTVRYSSSTKLTIDYTHVNADYSKTTYTAYDPSRGVGEGIDTPGWYQESDRYIDLGNSPQTVVPEFYEWFTANATKQTLVEISGIRVINLSPNVERGCYEPVRFTTTANSEYYVGIYIGRYWGSAEHNYDGLEYAKPNSNSYGTGYMLYTAYAESGTLDQTPYRQLSATNSVIDFGDEPQLVSVEFYNWLEANSSKFTHKIGGTRKWIAMPTYTQDFAIPIEFLSVGLEYDSIKITRASNGNAIIAYGDTMVYNGSTWTNQDYRTITFPLEGQSVTSEFHEWFTANIEEIEFLIIERQTLVEIANAIRAKTGSTDLIPVASIKSEIEKKLRSI